MSSGGSGRQGGHTHGEGEHCSCALQSAGAQSMLEMEFERGIWTAAMDGETEKVKRLIAGGVNPSATDTSGYTALHYASRSGHVGICQLLLSSGASANSQTPGGVTPLHRAAYCGHEGVVSLLLGRGADVRLVDSDGRTALHKAAEKGHYAVAKLLLASCPDSIKTQDKRGQVPLDLIGDAGVSGLRDLLML